MLAMAGFVKVNVTMFGDGGIAVSQETLVMTAAVSLSLYRLTTVFPFAPRRRVVAEIYALRNGRAMLFQALVVLSAEAEDDAASAEATWFTAALLCRGATQSPRRTASRPPLVRPPVRQGPQASLIARLSSTLSVHLYVSLVEQTRLTLLRDMDECPHDRVRLPTPNFRNGASGGQPRVQGFASCDLGRVFPRRLSLWNAG